MSGHLENDRSVTTGKMYPIDLAPQKITIVKSMSNAEVKMAHLIPVQTKTTSSNQIISHGNTGSMGLMRTGTQIISPGVTSQVWHHKLLLSYSSKQLKQIFALAS